MSKRERATPLDPPLALQTTAEPGSPCLAEAEVGEIQTGTCQNEAPEPTLSPARISALRAYLPDTLWQKLNHPRPERRDLQTIVNHLRSYLYLLSTYLPRHVVESYGAFAHHDETQHESAAILGEAEGSEMAGSLLFSDVSGFTKLSEMLAQQGADGIERLTEHLNAYFSRMLDILAQSNGILLKFAGDALLVHFPAQPENAQAAWAVRTAWRMMEAMQNLAQPDLAPDSHRNDDGFSLRMKIGIATGSFHALSAGTEQRREYIVLGETVTRTMAAEGHATAGQVLVDEATRRAFAYACYTAIAPGFHVATPATGVALGAFEIQGEIHRRGRSTAAWMGDRDQIRLEISRLYERIQALSAYLSEELTQWLREDAQRAGGHHGATLHSENRPTVVVFINVTGFEALLQQALGPDDQALVYSMMDDYFRAVHKSVTHFGGIISRIDPYKEGSKLLILFGAPQAHEDDAIRAVQAVLGLQAALEVLNRRWEQRLRNAPGFSAMAPGVEQRAGITYGVTFAGQVGASTRREYTVMGDDVNLAARLMGAGSPGQILASAAVAHILQSRYTAAPVVLHPLPPIRVKGKSHPLAIFQVAAPSSDSESALPAAVTELIGRESELAQAEGIVTEALASGIHQLAALGSAGIGKSLFTAVLAARLTATGVRVVIARCPAFNAGAYAVWISSIQQLASITPSASVELQADQLRSFLHTLTKVEPAHVQALFSLLALPYAPIMPATPTGISRPAATSEGVSRPSGGVFAQLGKRTPDNNIPRDAAAAPSLWQVAGTRKPSPQTQAAAAWRNLNARITRQQQARLVLALQQVLTRLAAQHPLVLIFEDFQWIDAASAALLQAVAAAPTTSCFLVFTVRRTEPEEASGYEQREALLALRPLSASQTSDMVAHLLSETIAADQLRKIGEIIYQKSQGNPLMVEELTLWWREHHHAGELTIDLQASVTLSELVMSRLDRLPAPLRAVVQAATIPDSDFTAQAMTALLFPDTAHTGVEHELRELTDRQILIAAETGATAHYSFRQTLVREIVYGSLTAARRRGYHDRFARYLEANAEGVQPGRLAHHHAQAGNQESAGRYLILSADTTAYQGALAQAQSAYEAALDALALAPSSARVQRLRARAYEGMGDVRFHLGDFTGSAHAYEKLHTDQTTGNPELPAELARIRTKRLLALFASADAETVGKEAETLYEMPGGDRFVAAAVSTWTATQRQTEDTAQIAARWREVAATAASYMKEDPLRLRALLADLDGKWEVVQDAYTTLEEPAGIALALCQQGEAWLQSGKPADAEIAYRAAERLWQRAGDTNGLALTVCRRSEVLWETGQHEAAERGLQAALTWMEMTGVAESADHAMIQSARAALEARQRPSRSVAGWQSCTNRLHALLLFQILETVAP